MELNMIDIIQNVSVLMKFYFFIKKQLLKQSARCFINCFYTLTKIKIVKLRIKGTLKCLLGLFYFLKR